MDANTNKTLTAALVALFVGVAFAPLATAAHTTDAPSVTGAPVALVDGFTTTTVTFNGTNVGTAWGGATLSRVIVPTTGVLRYNTTYDLTFTNLTGSGSGYGYTGGETSFRMISPTGFIVGNPRPASTDNAHSGRVNVTFPSHVFNETGVWNLTGASSNNTVASIFVHPQSDLAVTLTQTSFTYSSSSVSFGITVTGASGPVAGASLFGTGIPNGTTTGSNGQYQFFGSLPEAGTFTITAYRDFGGRALAGQALPESEGNTSYTVAAAGLTVTPVDSTIRTGFAENASWDIAYPNATKVFANAAGTGGAPNLGFIYANLSVTTPQGATLWYNATPNSSGTPSTATFTAGGGECGLVQWAQDAAAASSGIRNTSLATFGGLCSNTTTEAFSGGEWEWSDTGRFYFRPAATWATGTYSFSLIVNTAGTPTANTSQEFSATWSIAPTSPATVNIKVFNNTISGTQVTGLTVQPATITTGSGGTAAVGAYTLALLIQGTTQTQYPASGTGLGPFTATNVTVTGDVLPVRSTAVDVSTVATDGQVLISNVVPTRVNGNVVISVVWQGLTTQVTLPITRGADGSVSLSEIVVDQTTPITVTLRDAFGGPQTTGQVFFLDMAGTGNGNGGFFAGIGQTILNGTGAPGIGQNGQYTTSIKPTATGDLVVYGIIGAAAGGADNRNYTYAYVRVAPAHDVNVTLSRTSAMAGVQTYVYLNATNSDGSNAVGTASAAVSATTSRVYFLNATQFRNLQNNGTTAIDNSQVVYPQNLANEAIVTMDNAGTAGVNVNVTLAPGTYRVYVCGGFTAGATANCSSAKHDNLNTTPTFTVNAWRITYSPSQIASSLQLQANTTINVTVTDADGNLANGTLTLNATDVAARFDTVATSTSTTITITNGVGSFVATGKAVGNVTTHFDPSGSPTFTTTTNTKFQVVGANVTVTPTKIPVGRTSTVSVKVLSLTGVGLPGRVLRICGSPIGGPSSPDNPLLANSTGCTGAETTTADGTATFGIQPSTTGTLYLYVNDSRSATTLPVFAGLLITPSPATPTANQTVTVTVSTVSSPTIGEADVSIVVNRTFEGNTTQVTTLTTGANGQFVLPNVQQGTYTIRATKAGFDAATESFTVGAPTNVTPTGPSFVLSNLQLPDRVNVGQALTVSADITNNGTADGTANAILLVNNAQRGTQSVLVAKGAKETVAFDFTPTVAGTYSVTIRLATGETIAAKQVTVGQPTTTSPVTTSPVTTSPVTTSPVTTSPVTTSPVTTTPTTTTTPPEPTVPGFEVVALLAALGVALLVLRRRS